MYDGGEEDQELEPVEEEPTQEQPTQEAESSGGKLMIDLDKWEEVPGG
jgi:hypothetical protein